MTITDGKKPSRVEQFLADLAERVGSTFVQVFLASVLATSAGSVAARVDWLDSAFIGLLAAFAAFLTTVLSWTVHRKPFANAYLDLAYRAAITFGQTLLGYVVAAGAISALDFDWDSALKASALAAGAALLKALIGLNSRHTAGAATLVKSDLRLAA